MYTYMNKLKVDILLQFASRPRNIFSDIQRLALLGAEFFSPRAPSK